MSGRAQFNVGEPLAFFLTWTTYGTWLPGDDRGYRRKGHPEVQAPDPVLEAVARSMMKETAFTLVDEHRALVEKTIHRHCEIRNWVLHVVNARSNHVHVVVTSVGYEGETVRDQFKAWCTRALKAAGMTRTTFWTEGGSCRSINQEDDLEAAIAYVMEAQDRKGMEEP